MSKIIKLTTADEIKQAVKAGHTVYCQTKGYTVTNPVGEQWLICFTYNDYCIGLTWRDGVTLNGNSFWYEV